MDYDDRIPRIEDGVGDDGAQRRSADHIVAIHQSAKLAVIEVERDSAIINGTNSWRNINMAAEVVRVVAYVGRGAEIRVGTVRRTRRVISTTTMRRGLRISLTA